jgi:hypothetical protein
VFEKVLRLVPNIDANDSVDLGERLRQIKWKEKQNIIKDFDMINTIE